MQRVMLDGIGSVQSRVAQIKAQLAALNPAPPPPVVGVGAGASGGDDFASQLNAAMGEQYAAPAAGPAAGGRMAPVGLSPSATLNGYTLPAQQGRISSFGGPADTGVKPNETMALTGERARQPNDPWYVAMRWPLPGGKYPPWLKDARIVLEYQGRKVVVRPADWGPNSRTGRVVDAGPEVLKALGAQTDDQVKISWASDQNAALGPAV